MNHFEFMHFRPLEQNAPGGATVAIYPMENADTALIAIARCNPEDNFNKKIGRSIAAGRIQAYMQGRVGSAIAVRQVLINDPTRLKASVAELLVWEMEEDGLA